jgi:predicted AlkP superfamily phosphohydrolase/phosphomutase
LIGLDAGDARLIEQWSDEGWLPNIARMRARGTAWAPMDTPAEVFHVSAWPSIFTGTPADVHGLYHAYVTRPGHQGLLRPRPDHSPVPFLWKLLSDRRKRAIVMDAFLTCPLQDFNGVQIVDWGSWSWFWDPTVLPASVDKDIRKKFGSYPFEDHSRVGVTPVTDFSGFRSRLLAAVTKKTRVVKWLLESEEWDFFLVVFGEAHPAGHYLWHFHDTSYVLHPEAPALLRDSLRDVYVALDAAVGDLVRSVDDRTTVMLVSGDGMGPNYSGSHLLEDVLERMGVLRTGGAAENGESAGKNGRARAWRDPMVTVRNMIPQRLRMAVSDVLLSRQVKEQLSLRWKTAGIRWSGTQAFVIENANEGYVRINLKGREPLGTVEPGADYERLRDEIHRTAAGLTNPLTGRAAARAVYKTDDICSGPRRSDMPDIVIIWDVDAKVTTELLLQGHGLVRKPSASCLLPPYYTGNHAPHAFAVAIGPDVPQGCLHAGRSVLDLAPTILAEFDIEPPAHMTGHILGELRAPRGADGVRARTNGHTAPSS